MTRLRHVLGAEEHYLSMKRNCIYIMSNKNRTTFYVGVTNNLMRRRLEHRAELAGDGFCGRYNICDVVYVEYFDKIVDAIRREKQIKEYARARKLALIESRNPKMLSLQPPFFNYPTSYE